MKIKKYRPVFFEGFKDVYYDIKTKEELLNSNLCKPWVKSGFVISFSKSKIYEQGFIMAIKKNNEKDEKAEWWVVALVCNKKDIETLASWLPDFEVLRSQYKTQKGE